MIDPSIFGAYDVRGIYPDTLNEETAHAIGGAIIQHLGVSQIAVGRDMRVSGPALAAALIAGVTEQGADVIDLGLTTTDELYFAVGKFGYPAGVMVSASHNPGKYNGFKLCREQARPISSETGLKAIRDIAVGGRLPPKEHQGTVHTRDVLTDFVKHALGFIDPSAVRPLRLCIDAGNGMAGLIIPEVMRHLPCTYRPLFFDLDGRFPNHPASPIEPENMVDVQRAVREESADLGVAFDGDADRMFITDEHGDLVGGDMVTALVAKSLLARNPGATILYNLICSRSVPELIEKMGGTAVRTRVGHSFIKAQMRERNAIFGGEHSGHFYFRDNFYADSGLIALLVVLELISREGKPVSELIRVLDTRFRSGEVNSEVRDIPGHIQQVRERYADGRQDDLDGLTVQYDDWWFNLRPSNTEPLLRLNVEADSRELLKRKRDEVLAVIRA
ncbi:MAG TPA: phosphomannomutase/phosphoglucomutase [Chloroflexota bacterium]|nr:phosphomannomutase/phosphoglucomutase [Chloroflexota bacterium]